MTQVAEQPQTNLAVKPDPDLDLARMHPPRLPYHPLMQERFGVDRASWKALVEAIFPNAQTTESVILALGYCRARKLDPFKRNVHIVPIWNKELGRMVDTVWPGIGELRTTAFRTGEYAGRDKAEFGQVLTQKVGTRDMTFPEWAQVTVYRVLKGQRVAFAGPQVYWLETYATVKRNDDTPNDMWATRPRGQIEKCAEAAALRAAFPEEIGSDYIPEEVEHHAKQVTSITVDDDRPRGTAALVNKLKDRQQEDSQLPGDGLPTADDQSQSAAPDADGPNDGAQAGGEGGESQPEMVEVNGIRIRRHLPAEARAEVKFIDEAITVCKPPALSAPAARKKFHAADINSWGKLPTDRQNEKYAQLVGGTFDWK